MSEPIFEQKLLLNIFTDFFSHFFSGDLIVKSTQNKLTKVMAEVDSLKAVLEMKTEEIHALRLEKAKLEDKLEEFDRMKLDFGKVTAQLEDLKAQLNEKQVVERKLSEENRQLYDSVERELNAKRRITMEKEELEWKIRSSSRDGTMSMSMMEGMLKVSISRKKIYFVA